MAPPAQSPPGTQPPGPPPQAPPGEPPAPGAPAEPQQPQVRRPAADPALKFKELGSIKVLAVVFLGLTIAFSVMGNAMGDLGFAAVLTPEGLVGISLMVVGLVMAILVLFTKINADLRIMDLRTLFMFLSVIFVLSGTAIRRVAMNVGDIDYGELSMAIAFSFVFVLYMEYMDATNRFSKIGRMVIERNLTNFDFSYVLKNYMSRSLVYMVLVTVLAVIVVFMRNGLLMALQGSSPQLANSVELSSVYGLAISSAIVFTFTAIVLSFIFSHSYVAEVSKGISGAFSKEKLQEMSVQAQMAGQQPAAAQHSPVRR